MQRKRGRPRKKRLKDMIPEDLRKAIRWIEDIYDDYVEKSKHKPGPPSKKDWLEIREARDEILRRIEKHNKELERKREEAERAKAEEEENRRIKQMLESDDPAIWKRWHF